MQKIMKLSTVLILMLLASCASTGSSNLFYETRDDKYRFIQLCPYVELTLPGDAKDWEHFKYYKGNHYFRNHSMPHDVQYVAGPKSKFEFYNDSLDTNDKFLKYFYQWDADYLLKEEVKDAEGHRILEQNVSESKNDYIIWELYKGDKYYIFLFGMKNDIVVRLMTNIGPDRDAAKNYLYKIFEDIKCSNTCKG
jgi:hypothetical protein